MANKQERGHPETNLCLKQMSKFSAERRTQSHFCAEEDMRVPLEDALGH